MLLNYWVITQTCQPLTGKQYFNEIFLFVTFDGTLIQEANTGAHFDWHSINAFSHTALCNSWFWQFVKMSIKISDVLKGNISKLEFWSCSYKCNISMNK